MSTDFTGTVSSSGTVVTFKVTIPEIGQSYDITLQSDGRWSHSIPTADLASAPDNIKALFEVSNAGGVSPITSFDLQRATAPNTDIQFVPGKAPHVNSATTSSIDIWADTTELTKLSMRYKAATSSTWISRLPAQTELEFAHHEQDFPKDEGGTLQAGTLHDVELTFENAAGDTLVHLMQASTDAASNLSYPPTLTGPYTAASVPAISTTGLGGVVAMPGISDIEIVRMSTDGARPQYSKRAAFSADDLHFGIGQRVVEVANPGNTIIDFSSLISNEWSYSNVNPNFIYGTSGNRVVCVDTSKPVGSARTILRTFGQYGDLSLGRFEGALSNDDRRMLLVGDNSKMFVYDPVTDTEISAHVNVPGGGGFNYACISQSGKWVIGQEGSNLFKALATDLGNITTYGGEGDHNDLGYDIDGNEVNVALKNGRVAFRDLETNQITTVQVQDPGGARWGTGHISCRALDRPGWAMVSGQNGRALLNIKLKQGASTHGSAQEYEDWGWHFAADFVEAQDPDDGYDWQARATVSKSGLLVGCGTRMLNQHGSAQGYIIRFTG